MYKVLPQDVSTSSLKMLFSDIVWYSVFCFVLLMEAVSEREIKSVSVCLSGYLEMSSCVVCSALD